MKKILIVFIILFAFGSPQAFFPKKNKLKGIVKMETQLIPIDLNIEKPPTVTRSLKFNNRFACLDFHGDFALATLDDHLHMAFDVIRKGVPPGAVDNEVFGADETGKFMWCKSGWREAIIIDTESKKVIQKMASYDGNTFISTYYAVVEKDKFVYVSVINAGDSPQLFSVFDFIKDEPVAQIGKINFCYILQGSGDSGMIVATDKNKTRTWTNAKLQKNDIVFLPDDELTKVLTEKQFRYRSDRKAFSFDKRIIIGMGIGSLLQPFSVRWNPEKTDIKIEPIILQCPKPDIFGENWEISPDGNWCINKATRNWDTKNEYEAIVFYKVDNAFPNGLSTPIYGGLTSEDNKGCFINHDVLGPLYLDIPPSGDPVIYKLNQIPELLKNTVK
jgi:hypothetical protein